MMFFASCIGVLAALSAFTAALPGNYRVRKDGREVKRMEMYSSVTTTTETFTPTTTETVHTSLESQTGCADPIRFMVSTSSFSQENTTSTPHLETLPHWDTSTSSSPAPHVTGAWKTTDAEYVDTSTPSRSATYSEAWNATTFSTSTVGSGSVPWSTFPVMSDTYTHTTTPVQHINTFTPPRSWTSTKAWNSTLTAPTVIPGSVPWSTFPATSDTYTHATTPVQHLDTFTPPRSWTSTKAWNSTTSPTSTTAPESVPWSTFPVLSDTYTFTTTPGIPPLPHTVPPFAFNTTNYTVTRHPATATAVHTGPNFQNHNAGEVPPPEDFTTLPNGSVVIGTRLSPSETIPQALEILPTEDATASTSVYPTEDATASTSVYPTEGSDTTAETSATASEDGPHVQISVPGFTKTYTATIPPMITNLPLDPKLLKRHDPPTTSDCTTDVTELTPTSSYPTEISSSEVTVSYPTESSGSVPTISYPTETVPTISYPTETSSSCSSSTAETSETSCTDSSTVSSETYVPSTEEVSIPVPESTSTYDASEPPEITALWRRSTSTPPTSFVTGDFNISEWFETNTIEPAHPATMTPSVSTETTSEWNFTSWFTHWTATKTYTASAPEKTATLMRRSTSHCSTSTTSDVSDWWKTYTKEPAPTETPTDSDETTSGWDVSSWWTQWTATETDVTDVLRRAESTIGDYAGQKTTTSYPAGGPATTKPPFLPPKPFSTYSPETPSASGVPIESISPFLPPPSSTESTFSLETSWTTEVPTESISPFLPPPSSTQTSYDFGTTIDVKPTEEPDYPVPTVDTSAEPTSMWTHLIPSDGPTTTYMLRH